MSSQQSISQIETRFWAVHALYRDEVHLSVRWLLGVPHLARPSRPCKPWPCSRCLPARGAIFVFLSKYPNFLFARLDTYQSDICHVGNRWVVKSSLHAMTAWGRGFDSHTASFLGGTGGADVFSSLFVRHRGVWFHNRAYLDLINVIDNNYTVHCCTSIPGMY